MADKYIKKLIEKSQKKFSLEKYHEASMRITHRVFVGFPKTHPNDRNILILLTNPFAHQNEFYEFTLDSIGYVEEIDTITNSDGESAMKVRLWVKKGAPAIKAKTFVVK